MDAKGFELLMAAKMLGEGGGGVAMDAKGFERLMAAKILGKGSGGKIKELEGVPPLTFTANGQPLLDYKIYGNTVQIGTPTPDNPIVPSGCGERTENLFNGQGTDNFGYYDNANGRYVNDTRYKHWRFSVKEGDIIRWTQPGAGYGCYFSNGVYKGNFKTHDTPFTVPAGIDEITNNFERSAWVSAIATKNQPLPDHYIPYGYKLPLVSAGQDVDIYLGEVPTTRRIKKLVLTGEENWVLNNNRLMCIYKYTKGISYESVLCTHYISAKSFIEVFDTINSTAVTDQVIYINRGSTDVADFKAYLAAQYAAGTPVTVWYVLAEPETAVVNEPLMKIGDYTDTVSMEQAGVEIPTSRGSTTLDVDTTIKPSNVYIKYKS